MIDIKPRFFESENKILAHLEWEAIRVITFDGSHIDIVDAYPKFEQAQFHWNDPFNKKASDDHHEIKRKIREKEYSSLDDFYQALRPFLKPVARGKALRDRKKRTAQQAFQRERLGEAFIENKALLRDAHKVAFKLVEENAGINDISERVAQLLFNHSFTDVTDKQIATLFEYVQAQMDKHNTLDRTEAAIIDTNDKNTVFMWCKIKRKYPKGKTFTWTTKEGAKEARCSKSDVGPIMKKLTKLGAITLIQSGKAGKNSSRAALYRREV